MQVSGNKAPAFPTARAAEPVAVSVQSFSVSYFLMWAESTGKRPVTCSMHIQHEQEQHSFQPYRDFCWLCNFPHWLLWFGFAGWVAACLVASLCLLQKHLPCGCLLQVSWGTLEILCFEYGGNAGKQQMWWYMASMQVVFFLSKIQRK